MPNPRNFQQAMSHVNKRDGMRKGHRFGAGINKPNAKSTNNKERKNVTDDSDQPNKIAMKHFKKQVKYLLFDKIVITGVPGAAGVDAAGYSLVYQQQPLATDNGVT